MYKQICPLLLLIVPFLSCHGQNKVSQKSASTTVSDTGKPKLTNPESKTPFPYRHSVDAGLQEKSGDLWFGTSDGIYRYDGKLFTNYKIIEGLPVDHVSKILEDKEGNIWFGAIGGIVRYSPSLKKGYKLFTSVEISGLQALKPNLNNPEATKPVSQMMECKNGDIWFYAGYNLYRTDGKSSTAITTAVGQFLENEKVPFHCTQRGDFGICGMYEDKMGNILISTKACSCGPNVTYRLDMRRVNNPCILNNCKHNLHNPQELAAHNKEVAVSFTKMDWDNDKTNMAFTTVVEDKAGNIWVGSDSGVYKYDGTHFISFTKNDILSKSVVSIIYEDKGGSIWFGTAESANFKGNGVFLFDGKAMTQFNTKDGLCTSSPFKNDIITAITEDNTGWIWFGGDGGICYYDGKAFTNFTKKDGYNEQPVKCVLKDKGGNLWFGTWELGLYRYDGKSLTCFTENMPKP
jgi:hypothetical protein